MKKLCAWILCAVLLGLGACGQVVPETTVTKATTTIMPTTTSEASIRLPEITEPINHTVVNRIHPDMGEFTFTLKGVFTRRYGREYYEPSVIERININIIEIRDENGSLLQVLDGFETYQDLWTENNDYGFGLFELNNDGYLDIQLVRSVGHFSLCRYSWLWDNQQRLFVSNQQLNELYESWLEVTLDEGRIRCMSKGFLPNGMRWEFEWYEYRNDMFVLVESMITESYSEDDEWYGYVYTLVKKLIDGEMKTVSETREKFEEGEEP